MRRSPAFATLCAPVALACAPALAQVAPEGSAGAADPAIVVTAHRAPVRLDRVGQSITVLDEEAIEASQQIGVAELLAQTPGISFARNGGRGTVTSLFIRGAESGQSVVLYDGVRLNDPSATDGGALIGDIVTAGVQRIEVLRGAQSTLYGSQAIGGVINIITQVPAGPFEAEMQLEAGERDSYLAQAALGGRRGGVGWRAGAGYTKTGGVSAYAPGTERDGYENISLNGRLDFAPAEGVALDLRTFYTTADGEFDSFDSDARLRSENAAWTGYAGLRFDLAGHLSNRFAYTRTDTSRISRDLDQALPATFRAKGETDRFEYQGTLDLDERLLAVFGVDYAENAMLTASPSQFDPDPVPVRGEDHTLGIYGQVQVSPLEGLALTGGVRREDHSTFGGSTVGSASAAWSPGEDTVLRASWAQGFKAPSLYQLYSEYGNTGLEPEKAESWDAGIEQRVLDVLSLSAVYFNRTSTDFIDFAYCSGEAGNPLCADGRFGYYENVGRFEAEGLELGAAIELGALSAAANYTLLDAVNASPGDLNRGNRLARRPKHLGNANLAYTWRGGMVTAATLRVAGSSFNDAANTQPLGSYALVDLRLAYPLSDRIEVYGRIENLLDARYETVRDAGTLPRLAYAGVRLRL
jgi:vitamin B12 transporter